MMILNEGVILVTGRHDVGKTSFCLECGADPGRILFIDDDVKGRATIRQLGKTDNPLGQYVDFASQTRGMTQLEMHQHGIDLIDKIEPGKFAVCVWDTWTRFYESFKSFVSSNPLKFKTQLEWKVRGDIKGSLEWKEAQYYEASVLAHLQSKTPLVLLTSHLKAEYTEDGKKTGRMKPAISRTLDRVPRMRLWLKHTVDSPVPTALVLKRIDEKRMTDHGLRTVNILPRKITPRSDDQSLWDTIAGYIANPIGNRPPTPEETPTLEELAILDNVYTPEQKEMLLLQLRAAVGEVEEIVPVQPVDDEKRTAAVKLHKAGETPMAIAKELDVNLPTVLGWIK